MPPTANYLAFDLGAESGRAVLGKFDGERISLQDVHRFANQPVKVLDTLYWDVLGLFAEIKRGLAMAAAEKIELEAIGIDTWGVDFGLLGRDDALLSNPRHYRDHANDGMLEAAFRIVPRERIFARTGIQFMQLNSLYQLLSMQRAGSPALEAAHTLLFTPDLLNFWLTGVKSTEFSIASTSQLVDPAARGWAHDLISEFGLPARIFTGIVPTGALVGELREGIREECGVGPTTIVATGEHDTASAVVAVPASSPDYAYISSGTWSLVGVETSGPLITPETQAANFTNEGGACDTIRLLKNVMGLWLVQECRRSWARAGDELSYARLTDLAELAPAFGPLIEPDHTDFLAPQDMRAAITAYCRRSGQRTPETPGEIVRCCLESLALKYRWVVERIEMFRGKPIDTIHVVGGGTQNRLLCQLAADATGRLVIAGPVEATALGNVLMQAYGRGHIGSLSQARDVVRRSFNLETFEPAANREPWDSAYELMLKLHEQAESTI